MRRLPARHPDYQPARNYLHLLALVVILLLPFVTLGQGSGRESTGNGGDHMILGKVFFPSGRRAEGTIQVKLQTLGAGELSVMADSSGAFSFTSLSPGNYNVVVIAGDAYEIGRETVSIDSDLNLSRMNLPNIHTTRRYTVMITLQLKRNPANAKTSVVNAALAEVPESARTLYEKGLEQGRAGDSQKAIDNLKAAISLYPKFSLALNELGVQYLKLNQPQKAVDPLRSATKLSPEAFTPKLNLGIALLETQQFTAAEAQLREALERNMRAPTAHMYLGISLIKLKRYDDARKELELAISNGGENLAPVHRYLGGLYQVAQKNKEAADELEKYLKLDPKAADAEVIKGIVKDLRGKS
jgi:Flp pilus assembly protein TadD